MIMKTLDEICIAHETDKASRHPYAGHDYAKRYDALFSVLRDHPVKLLEIGVGGGQSVKAWLDYFPAGRVFGVDIVHDTNEWNTPGTKGRYTFCQGDQAHDVFWKCFLATYGRDFDIIIDDGGHFNDGIITSFNEIWTAVRPGGYYAIEDLGCAYGAGSIFVKPGFPNHMTWLHDRLDNLNVGTGLDSMYFSKELAVIRKAL